ncbi:thyroglobulin type-1 repeat-containing protein, partial [Salmonella sp. s54925]|uniref:thyroglobulin type-1 repeat-containing protein n=1 Tax=Salmonella sp. s54925 TaxID=3159674 RepID=UPI0039804E76
SGSTGYCWCVSPDNTKWPGTSVRGEPDCSDKKRPEIRSVRVQLSFDADFNTVKDNLDEFERAFTERMKDQFGVHPKQINDLEVTSGSIIVKFVLLKHEDGKDVRNVSSNLRNMILKGEF